MIKMDIHDNELQKFEAEGRIVTRPKRSRLPRTQWSSDLVFHLRVRLAVILPHGGLGHSGNWGYQVPTLIGSGYHTVLIDSRGHGRSARRATVLV